MYIFGTRGASGWKNGLKDFFLFSVIDSRLRVVVIVGTPLEVGGHRAGTSIDIGCNVGANLWYQLCILLRVNDM